VDVSDTLPFVKTNPDSQPAMGVPRGSTAVSGARSGPRRVATEPDWSREERRRRWDPGRCLLRCIRAYQTTATWWPPLRKVARAFLIPRHWFWSAVAGTDIPLNAQLGGGVMLPHPNGIVIHPRARIGPNCLIFQQVTIGTRGWNRPAPVIGAGVEIGAGAKVLGPITIGDGARIGANAVVMSDVPPGCTAVGIPARVVNRRKMRKAS
jgi:serine O-acetyltransferase